MPRLQKRARKSAQLAKKKIKGDTETSVDEEQIDAAIVEAREKNMLKTRFVLGLALAMILTNGLQKGL